MSLRPEILGRRAELEELCRRFHVKRLEVFGSAATEQFDPARSDVDLLVEFQALSPREYAAAYFGLLSALETLFHRPVDLGTPRDIRNKYFLLSINRTRTLIYAA
ncbi:MAG: nucleotidyltransferase domain-containing protein [Planctomycetota bacterium]